MSDELFFTVRGERRFLAMGGADRSRFLNGLVTCEIRGLESCGAYGFATNHQGRVLADLAVWSLPDLLVLDVPADGFDVLVAHFEKYRVADQVEIVRHGSPLAILAESWDLLGTALGINQEQMWQALPLERGLESRGCWALRHHLLGGPGYLLFVVNGEPVDLRGLAEELGAREVEAEVVTRRQIQHGVPRFGADFDQRSLPQETGLEAVAVSYTKGCYLGQEIVARVHYRGQAPWALCGLQAPRGAPAPQVGSTLWLEDGEKITEVGTVTSMAGISPTDRVPTALRGLARVKRAAAVAGNRLEWRSGDSSSGAPAAGSAVVEPAAAALA